MSGFLDLWVASSLFQIVLSCLNEVALGFSKSHRFLYLGDLYFRNPALLRLFVMQLEYIFVRKLITDYRIAT